MDIEEQILQTTQNKCDEFRKGAVLAYRYWQNRISQDYLNSWGTKGYDAVDELIMLGQNDKFIEKIYHATEGRTKAFFDGAVWSSRNFFFKPLTDKTLDKRERVVIVAGYNCKVA